MRDLVAGIVKCLVDKEDAIVITEKEVEGTVFFEVKVDTTDTGKIIGKEGRNAQAIRTIMKAASKKYNKKYMFNII